MGWSYKQRRWSYDVGQKDLWVSEISSLKWVDIEAVTSELISRKKKVLLPSSTGLWAIMKTWMQNCYKEFLQSVIGTAKDYMLLCSDLNYRGIDWANNMVVGGSCSDQAKFYEA